MAQVAWISGLWSGFVDHSLPSSRGQLLAPFDSFSACSRIVSCLMLSKQALQPSLAGIENAMGYSLGPLGSDESDQANLLTRDEPV